MLTGCRNTRTHRPIGVPIGPNVARRTDTAVLLMNSVKPRVTLLTCVADQMILKK